MPSDAAHTIFVCEIDEESWSRKGQKRMECFAVSDAEVEVALRTDPALSCKDDAWPIARYGVDMVQIDDLAGYQVAQTSVDRYGIEVCSAEILFGLFAYGYNEEERMYNIQEAQKRAERTAMELNAAGAEEFLEDDVFQDVLNNCADEDEYMYLKAQHEFRKAVRDIELRHVWMVHCDNKNKMLAMIREEFMARHA